MDLRVFACVRESVFLKGLESAFPAPGAVLCGGAVDEAVMFDALPLARPDVLIYDPGFEENFPYVNLLRRNFPRMAVLVLFEPGCEDWAPQVTARGAAECLPKTLTREALLQAVERVAPEPQAEAPDLVRPSALPFVPGSEAIERRRLSSLLLELE